MWKLCKFKTWMHCIFFLKILNHFRVYCQKLYPTAVVCIYSCLSLLYKRIGKLEAKISKNPYSQEPTSRPEYETPYDSVHSSEDASHVYMELDDVPRPPPSGHAGKSDVFQLWHKRSKTGCLHSLCKVISTYK